MSTGYLRGVPSDSNPNDGRLYDPTQPDTPVAGDFVPSWARGMLVVAALSWAVPASAVPRPVQIAPLLDVPVVVADQPFRRDTVPVGAWSIDWTAQRGARIAPLTLPTGDAPPIIGARVPVAVVPQWAQEWKAQARGPVVAISLPTGDQPPRYRAPSVADRWGVSWGAQRQAPVAAVTAAAAFPTQYAGFRTYYNGAIKELCLVSFADRATGMGAAPLLNKNGTTYAVYLVETTDPNASSVRINTSAGVKSIRLKT